MKRFILMPALFCLVFVGCDKPNQRKPDPTKGSVTGTVICSDTGKPARFATVFLTPAPRAGATAESTEPLHSEDNMITGLEGEFRIEAVPPGQYYAFATLEGYLDPERGIDFSRLSTLSNDTERGKDAIAQWKEQLVEVTVQVHRASNISLVLHRGAEIKGTVTFDDGSPAIGMHFSLARKTAANTFSGVGTTLMGGWALDSTSDGHGRFGITGLLPGEYRVCTLLPDDSEDSAPRVCMGNTWRKKNATTVKVAAGEVLNGEDIIIPLTGLHTISGHVDAVSDGHAPSQATVRLLYADDREQARQTTIEKDGSFTFSYVAEDKYILQVTGAENKPEDTSTGNATDAAVTADAQVRLFADKEIPLTVQADVDDLEISLIDKPKEVPASQ